MKLATDCTGRPVIAIDPSLTSTGLAYPIDHDVLAVDIVAAPSGVVGWERLDLISTTIRVAVRTVIALYGVEPIIVMEGYSYASKHSQAHSTGELGGVIVTDLGRIDHDVVRIAPKSIKKFATGRGNASKAAMVSAVAARTGWQFRTDDQADAVALWCFARAVVSEPHPMEPLPKTHLAALTEYDIC